ncbi:tRNA sulfurtransferase [Candidatus Erwinia haradaeae]|uniref:tRNA sulfurtransferase, partial n=1 Tax=Candidatus Erwinia haradaeae TaxID=1922217 RepID=A0A451DCD5_9GAMM|nr:tRNA sulfurtransferase [Candidatus Erwinia haradaeae]
MEKKNHAWIRVLVIKNNRHKIERIENIKWCNLKYIILDIRTQEEQEKCPLSLENVLIKSLPFYKLSSQFNTLDPNKTYLLYCDHGIMSRLQTLLLHEKGFQNVQAYNSKQKIKDD